jgi:hypothetical protein
VIIISDLGAELSAQPARIDIGGDNPTARLIVTCRPSSQSVTVYSMELGKCDRDACSNTKTGMIQIHHTRPEKVDIVSDDSSLKTRLNSSGKISAIDSHLTLTLSDLQCTDAGWYYCAVNASLMSSTEQETSEEIIYTKYRSKCLILETHVTIA